MEKKRAGNKRFTGALGGRTKERHTRKRVALLEWDEIFNLWQNFIHKSFLAGDETEALLSFQV